MREAVEDTIVSVVVRVVWIFMAIGVGDVCFFLTMRCFPILNDAMF